MPGYFLYGENNPDVDLDTLHIEELLERSSRHDWIIRPHHHPRHIQLMLITKGGASTLIEGQQFDLEAGTLMVHPVGMVHEIRYQPGSAGPTITVAKSYVDALLRDTPQMLAPLAKPQAYALGKLTADVAMGFQQIQQESRMRAAGWNIAMRGHFLTILVHLQRLQQAGHQPLKGRRDLQLAQALRDIVEAEFRQQKAMAFYASRLAISPQRLNAACQTALGCSASQVLHDRTMVEARRLLAYTERTIAEIAHDLGYDDPAYFNRFFSARAGQPPGAWRATYSATQRADHHEQSNSPR